jgi:2,3-bisphosphoglycerate-independent phosphoglycerate mutase
MKEQFDLNPAAIAVYPMYKGLAQLVGMKILKTGKDLNAEIKTLAEHYNCFDFFFLHCKKTDSYGEDGDFRRKVKEIEAFDRLLPRILDLEPDVLAITGDHSTPTVLRSHSWHPNPFLLNAEYQRHQPENVAGFSEKSCLGGVLGRFPAMDILPLMMANALKLKKYGA